MKIHCTEIY